MKRPAESDLNIPMGWGCICSRTVTLVNGVRMSSPKLHYYSITKPLIINHCRGHSQPPYGAKPSLIVGSYCTASATKFAFAYESKRILTL